MGIASQASQVDVERAGATQIGGDDDAWRAWWEDPESEHYYFIGKDNIPFHTIVWPAMLMGYGGLTLPEGSRKGLQARAPAGAVRR